MKLKDIKIGTKVTIKQELHENHKWGTGEGYRKVMATLGNTSTIKELDKFHWQDVKLENGLWYNHNDLFTS